MFLAEVKRFSFCLLLLGIIRPRDLVLKPVIFSFSQKTFTKQEQSENN